MWCPASAVKMGRDKGYRVSRWHSWFLGPLWFLSLLILRLQPPIKISLKVKYLPPHPSYAAGTNSVRMFGCDSEIQHFLFPVWFQCSAYLENSCPFDPKEVLPPTDSRWILGSGRSLYSENLWCVCVLCLYHVCIRAVWISPCVC